LNTKFGIAGTVKFVPGKNNLTKAVLTNPSARSTAEIYLHGAHVTSWVTKQGEHLFLSDKSVFDVGKAIRGGIPLIFPQFGPGKLQAHGFARNLDWQVINTKFIPGDSSPDVVCIDLQLCENKFSRDMWPHSFAAILTLRLSNKLTVEMQVKNTGDSVFPFQAALHTYFLVSNIANVMITGLTDVPYVDKVKNGITELETRQAVTISQEVDRVYLDVKHNPISIIDSGHGVTLRLEREHLPEVVVWNPWAEKARAMGDLGEAAFPKFVCVEVGCIEKPVTLSPGETWRATHTIDAISSAL